MRARFNVRFGSFSDIDPHDGNVRCTP